MEAWLLKQPREVSAAFAARAALRVLPAVHVAERDGYLGDLYLPLFRAAGVAWIIARYSARENELGTAARDAAVIAEAVSISTAVGFVSRTDAASRATVRSDAFAAAVASGVGDPGAPRNALKFGARAIGYSDAIALGAGAGAYISGAEAGFWFAVSADTVLIEQRKVASDIAGSPLWPNGLPAEVQSLWEEMKTALLAGNRDWDVWTDWYDNRLAGRVRDDERELAYVHIDNHLWDTGPAAVSA